MSLLSKTSTADESKGLLFVVLPPLVNLLPDWLAPRSRGSLQIACSAVSAVSLHTTEFLIVKTERPKYLQFQIGVALAAFRADWGG